MTITLFPHQAKLKEETYQAWDSGITNILDVLPTGGGKSVIVSDITLDCARLGMMQSIIAHRNELVSQMSMHIARRGIPHRIIGPDSTIAQITRQHRASFYGQSYISPTARCSVIGVDTLIARKVELGSWAAQHDQWTIDEAHHVLLHNKWGAAVEMFPRARGLGVTATAVRADGYGLGRPKLGGDGVFDHMNIGPSMRELITGGFLSDYEIVCPSSDLEMHEEDIGASGDYSAQKMRKAAKKSRIVGDVVENYCKFAFGKRAICFATDVETSGEIAQKFIAYGIRAAALSAKTPDAVREKYVKDFKEGRLTVLINVDLFGEGFDCPACEVVILARPTASLGLYLQMVGRALRTADGKLYGLIIDHVGNIVRHKFPDKPHVWSLARRDKRGKSKPDPDDMPLRVCTYADCAKPYERFLLLCPHCKRAPALPESRERSIEMVDGDLMLLTREKLEQMRAATMIESAAAMADRVLAVAGPIAAKARLNSQMEKIGAQQRLEHAIAQWAAIRREKGDNDREIHKRFFLATGMDILTARDASRPRQEFESLATTVEGWYMR